MNPNSKFIFRCLGVFSFVLILPFPTEFYFFARVVVFSGAIYAAIQVQKLPSSKGDPVFFFLCAIAFIFNPIIMIFLYSKAIWAILNILAAYTFFKTASLFNEVQMSGSSVAARHETQNIPPSKNKEGQNSPASNQTPEAGMQNLQRAEKRAEMRKKYFIPEKNKEVQDPTASNQTPTTMDNSKLAEEKEKHRSFKGILGANLGIVVLVLVFVVRCATGPSEPYDDRPSIWMDGGR